jgi:hypothetical protein
MDPLKQMGTKELICIDELTGSAHGVHVAGDSDELYKSRGIMLAICRRKLQVQLLTPVSGKKRPEMLREQIGWVGPNARGS